MNKLANSTVVRNLKLFNSISNKASKNYLRYSTFNNSSIQTVLNKTNNNIIYNNKLIITIERFFFFFTFYNLLSR